VSLFKRGECIGRLDGRRHPAEKSTGTGNRKQPKPLRHAQRLRPMRGRFGLPESNRVVVCGLSARFLANGTVRPYHVNRLKHLLRF